MGGRSGQSVTRNTAQSVNKQALSNAEIEKHRMELGKKIEYNGEKITIKEAIEKDLIAGKRIIRSENRRGDSTLENQLTLKNNTSIVVSKSLHNDLNIEDKTNQDTEKFIKKYEGYIKNGKLKYEDWLKANK